MQGGGRLQLVLVLRIVSVHYVSRYRLHRLKTAGSCPRSGHSEPKRLQTVWHAEVLTVGSRFEATAPSQMCFKIITESSSLYECSTLGEGVPKFGGVLRETRLH